MRIGFQEVPFYPRSLPLTVNRAAVHVSAHSALETYGRVAYVTPLLVPAAWGHGGLPHTPINQLPELRRKQKHPCLYCDKHFDWPSTLRVRSHAIPAALQSEHFIAQIPGAHFSRHCDLIMDFQFAMTFNRSIRAISNKMSYVGQCG